MDRRASAAEELNESLAAAALLRFHHHPPCKTRKKKKKCILTLCLLKKNALRSTSFPSVVTQQGNTEIPLTETQEAAAAAVNLLVKPKEEEFPHQVQLMWLVRLERDGQRARPMTLQAWPSKPPSAVSGPASQRTAGGAVYTRLAASGSPCQDSAIKGRDEDARTVFTRIAVEKKKKKYVMSCAKELFSRPDEAYILFIL